MIEEQFMIMAKTVINGLAAKGHGRFSLFRR